MLSLAANMRIWLCTAPTDMRKSFDGLSGLVQSVFARDVLEGHLFVFVNRRRDRVKLLWWDRDGLALWYKRLESGTFETPRPGDDRPHVELDATEMAMLLGGVSLASAKRRKRYAPSPCPAEASRRQAG
jgi:transposase